jgi:RHS repeat-associated protein
MHRIIRVAAGTLLGIVSFMGVARAQGEIEPYQEYDKRVKASQTVSPLASNLFGENVSLYNGSTEFRATDVEIPGNDALPVRLARRFKIESRKGMGYLGGFGQWDIEVPYMHGIFQDHIGWSSNVGGRCSAGVEPRISSYWYELDEIWAGASSMHIPGEGDQELLKNNSPKSPAVTDGQTYPWVTSGDYRIRCLSSTANGYPGEGFVAVSPSGVKYYFNHGVELRAPTLGKPTADLSKTVYRKRVLLLATRVEDRFGNSVTYTYSGSRLTSITSSDGRQITLAYDPSHGSVASVTTGDGRSWTYQYSGSTLIGVTQPDGSKWTYTTLKGFGDMAPVWGWSPPWEGPENVCIEPDYGYGEVQIQIGHPSGAIGTFDFDFRRTYREGAPDTCFQREPGDNYQLVSNYFDNYQLLRKQVEGSGVGNNIWTYTYDHYTYDPNTLPGACENCGSWRDVTVTEPDGTKTAHRFGSTYGVNEGRLLGERRIDAAGNVVKTTSINYVSNADIASMPFPDRYGQSLVQSFDVDSNRVRPLLTKTITQDGVSFYKQVTAFDQFAKELSVNRFSSLGYSKKDVYEYEHNRNIWVVGQVRSFASTNDTSRPAIKASETVFNSLALPEKTYSYGKLRQTLGYYPEGMLKTIVDGRNNTTTLSDWHRGTPRLITHPDATTESAGVDGAGWIRSVVDETGARTCYEYDRMGRVAQITYPSESIIGACDIGKWARTTLDFAYSNQSAYGLLPGHWRHTVSTGNARKVTYYDAFWRPVVEEAYDAANPTNTRTISFKRYDQSGQVQFQGYPRSSLASYATATGGTTNSYDALGRVRTSVQDSELGSLTTSSEYLSGFQTRTTNPRGKATTNSYVVYDDPNYSLLRSSVMPAGRMIEIARNLVDKPRSLTQRSTAAGGLSLTRKYVYDMHMQLCKMIEPENGSTMMSYDESGNLFWTVSGLQSPNPDDCDHATGWNSNRWVWRQFDPRNRIRYLRFPDKNGDQDYVYEADGQIKTVTTWNSAGATLVVNGYNYNSRRLLTGESQVHEGLNWAVGYEYDANANRSTMTYPAGLTVTYSPNALGQPQHVVGNSVTYAQNIQYHPNGATKSFTFGNGIQHAMVQNARQMPASVVNTGVLDYQYGYDENGNVSVIYDHARGNTYNRWMHYDDADRLEKAGSASFGGDHWHRFTYDALDNISSWKLEGVKDYASYYYNPANNRLENILSSAGASVVGMSYDDQGNLTQKNSKTFKFDFGNRLREAQSTEKYRYDAFGRRILTESSNGRNYTLYSKEGQLLWERDERVSARLQNVYLNGTILVTRRRPIGVESETILYNHNDALGSQVALSDSSQAVPLRKDYDPYGGMASIPNNRPGHTGHAMDVPTGMTYMQQRYYDASIGRFLSTDPVSPDPSSGDHFARYRYASNNPFRFVDPDGRRDRDTAKELANDRRSLASRPGISGFGAGVTAASRGATIPTAGTAPGAGGFASGLATFLRGAAVRGVITMPLVIGGDSRDDGKVSVYRVVGAAEYASIYATRQWSLPPNGYDQKQFWTSVADAQRFAGMEKAGNLPGTDDYRFIMGSRISRETAASGHSLELDGRWALSFDAAGLFRVNQDAQSNGGIQMIRTIDP